MAIDIKLDKFDDKKYFDIDIDTNGDFKLVDSFETASLLSVLAERRASESEVAKSSRRRGWIGNESNEVSGFELGSKVWLIIEQGRINTNTKNRVVSLIQESLKWLIEDGHLRDIIVSARITDGEIIATINYIIPNGDVLTTSIGLWEEFARS